ncbi:unnamed protein product, partial [Cladocopium goreaui]
TAQKALLAVSALLLVAIFSFTWPQVQEAEVDVVPEARHRTGKGKHKKHKRKEQGGTQGASKNDVPSVQAEKQMLKDVEGKDNEDTVTQVKPQEPAVLDPEAQPAWIFCAGQWQECICGGRVKWGNDEKWQIIELPKDKQMQKVVCSIDVLGDIIPGDGGKHCQCEVTPG